jgi:hypothetical protein
VICRGGFGGESVEVRFGDVVAEGFGEVFLEIIFGPDAADEKGVNFRNFLLSTDEQCPIPFQNSFGFIAEILGRWV